MQEGCKQQVYGTDRYCHLKAAVDSMKILVGHMCNCMAATILYGRNLCWPQFIPAAIKTGRSLILAAISKWPEIHWPQLHWPQLPGNRNSDTGLSGTEEYSTHLHGHPMYSGMSWPMSFPPWSLAVGLCLKTLSGPAAMKRWPRGHSYSKPRNTLTVKPLERPVCTKQSKE